MPYITDDAAQALLHFQPLVAAIPPEQRSPWKGGADIIRVNVERAVEAVLPHLAAVIPKKLPAVDADAIRELPTLAIALVYAADRVAGPPSPDVLARQKTMRPMRKLALMQLQIFAGLGLVPAERVEKIADGRGPVDEANDCIAIPDAFREYDGKVSGKHPFTKEQLEQLAADGNWLKANIKVEGALADSSVPDPDAVVRDQLYAEIKRRYDDVFKVAVEVWGRKDADDHISALHARTRAEPQPKAPTKTVKAPVVGGAGTGAKIDGAVAPSAVENGEPKK